MLNSFIQQHTLEQYFASIPPFDSFYANLFSRYKPSDVKIDSMALNALRAKYQKQFRARYFNYKQLELFNTKNNDLLIQKITLFDSSSRKLIKKYKYCVYVNNKMAGKPYLIFIDQELIQGVQNNFDFAIREIYRGFKSRAELSQYKQQDSIRKAKFPVTQLVEELVEETIKPTSPDTVQSVTEMYTDELGNALLRHNIRKNNRTHRRNEELVFNAIHYDLGLPDASNSDRGVWIYHKSKDGLETDLSDFIFFAESVGLQMFYTLNHQRCVAHVFNDTMHPYMYQTLVLTKKQ